MNIIYNTIIFLLYSKIIESSDNKYNNFLNTINKLKENSRALEILDLKKNEITNKHRKVKILNNKIAKIQSMNSIPNFMSKFSFMQNNNSNKKFKSIDNGKEGKNKNYEFFDAKSKLETHDIVKRGEYFYIDDNNTKTEYNNEDIFYSNLFNNHNNNIKIYSPCINMSKETCKNNNSCFYDKEYKACFQKCKILEENECSKYSECKYTNNYCANEGYLNLEIFGNNLGSDIRGCELFETESSCLLMEKHYKKLVEENKTNFNCMWISYKHEWKDKNEIEIINEHEVETDNESRKNEKNGGINYHILKSDEPKEIAKNEKFISLLELRLNDKKKMNANNNNKIDDNKNKKNKLIKEGETEEKIYIDENNKKEGMEDEYEEDHDNANEHEDKFEKDNDREEKNEKKNNKILKGEILINAKNEKNIPYENDKNNLSIDIHKNVEKDKKLLQNNEDNIENDNKKDILKHNFHGKEIKKLETHICANLNEKPNPSVLLEATLLAENEAELRKIKKKYKVTEDEICVRPTKESYISFTPDKSFYLIGEKIEFTCKEGYILLSTTNIGICIGRNKIVPNIICEPSNNFNENEKANIEKINNLFNSDINFTFSKLAGLIILIFNIFYYF